MKILSKGILTGQIKNHFAYSGWPSLCRDENNNAYAVCSGNRVAHVCPFGKIMMYKSRNGGEKWSVPSVPIDNYLDDRDPGINYLGNGKLILTYFRHPADVYENHYRNWIINDTGSLGAGLLDLFPTIKGDDRLGGSFMSISDDYGETWSEEKRIPVHCPHGPIVLDNGDIFYLGKEMYSYGAEEKDIIASYISKDGGNTFSKIGECNKPKEYSWNQFHEPHCIQLSDGRILGLIRAHIDKNGENFTIYKTFSEDGGKTWSEFQPTGICGSPPHLLKLKNGKILLTYGRRMKPFGIYGKLISEDGIFDNEDFLIDAANDSDLGYPCSVQFDNGELMTVFYKKELSDRYCSIVYVKFTL